MILNLLDIGRADEGQLVPVVREIDAARSSTACSSS